MNSSNVKKEIGKVMTFILCLCAGILIAGTVGIKAASDEFGEIIRVSGAKELKKAMDDPAVGTIFFSTEKYIDLTIKPNENAKNKMLLIEAEHANINNKAVFAEIQIRTIHDYVENVSGNVIILNDPTQMNSFTVAKKKTVSLLIMNTSSVYTNLNNNYVLRNGAKVEGLGLLYYESADKDPIVGLFDKDKREVSIEYADTLGDKRSYNFKLDERGRIVKMVSNATNKFDYNFTYDKNGKIASLTGSDDEDGNCKETRTYDGDFLVKIDFESDVRRNEEFYTYDEKGNLTRKKIVTSSEDGRYVQTFGFSYDSKGRISAECMDSGEGDYKAVYVHTYNSKGFLVKSIGTFYNADGDLVDEEVRIYKFNKAGDLVKYTVTCGGETEVREYKYNEIGYLEDVDSTYDNGTGRVDLDMTDEEFRDFYHRLFLVNQQEAMFERHSSQTITIVNDFPLAEEAAYFYYVTPDSIYQEADTWIEYEKDRLVYQLYDMNDPDKSTMIYLFDLRPDSDIQRWRYIPTDESRWMNYEHDHMFSVYIEDGLIHVLSRYDEDLSREFAEEFIGVEYKGESYITEIIFDEKTLDYIQAIVTKELNGSSEIVDMVFIDYDLPEPAACKAVRAAFGRKDANMAKATFVVDQGTKNEIKTSGMVPYNSNVSFYIDDVDNIKVFSDSKCTEPVTGLWDKMSDLTRYIVHVESDN